MNLNGKVAMVTGGAQGLGTAHALALAKAGADIALLDIDLPKCEETAHQLASATGKRCVPVKADVRVPAELQQAVDKVVAELSGLHVLVNNAGVLVRKEVLDMTAEDWDWVMDVNLKGMFLCSQAAARQMIKQGQGGRIINISSIASFLGQPTRSAYCTSKGGVNQLTKVLAMEFARYNITVNAVAPGITSSDMRKITDVKGTSLSPHGAAEPERFFQELLARIPLNRRASPEDIANTVVFLASPSADYITGQTIVVDGGMTIH